MQLLLFRHGDALPVGQEDISTDEERPLSPKGEKQVGQSAKGLASIGLVPDLILTSPLIRAMQTAAIIAEATGAKGAVEQCPALAPGSPLQQLLARLGKALQKKCVCCVGHQPDLGRLVSLFVWGSAHVEVPLKKAGVCHFEIGESLEQAKLVALLAPKVLAALAQAEE